MTEDPPDISTSQTANSTTRINDEVTDVGFKNGSIDSTTNEKTDDLTIYTSTVVAHDEQTAAGHSGSGTTNDGFDTSDHGRHDDTLNGAAFDPDPPPNSSTDNQTIIQSNYGPDGGQRVTETQNSSSSSPTNSPSVPTVTPIGPGNGGPISATSYEVPERGVPTSGSTFSEPVAVGPVGNNQGPGTTATPAAAGAAVPAADAAGAQRHLDTYQPGRKRGHH